MRRSVPRLPPPQQRRNKVRCSISIYFFFICSVDFFHKEIWAHHATRSNTVPIAYHLYIMYFIYFRFHVASLVLFVVLYVLYVPGYALFRESLFILPVLF